MNKKRSLAARADAELHSERPRFYERIDLALVALFLILSLSLLVVIASVVAERNAAGTFERDFLDYLPDQRLLTNIRDDLASAPLLDAVWHQPIGEVILSQKGGRLHRYEPARRLWRDMEPFSSKDLRNVDLTSLRSGYGDPRGLLADGARKLNMVWAKTGANGLVRFYQGNWQVVVSDSLFFGLDDNKVQHELLSAVAISDNRDLLALGTTAQGIGMYRVADRRWFSPGRQISGSPHVIEQIVWWRDRFWIDGSNGLYQLVPSAGGAEVTRLWSGDILDMDCEGEEALWVLMRGDCQETGASCLQMQRFTKPDSDPEILFNEQNHYDELDLSQQFHALYQAPFLYLAGRAGLFCYDTRTHSWSDLLKDRVPHKEVTAALGLPSHDGFFLGGEGWLGCLIDGLFTPLSLKHADDTLKSLTPGTDDEVLALTQNGDALALNLDGNNRPMARILFKGNGSNLKPAQMKKAIALDNDILFTASSGAMLHNTEKRTYTNFLKAPSWLTEDNLQFVRSANMFYSVQFDGNSGLAHQLPWNDLVTGNFVTAKATANLPPARTPMREWAGGGIAYVSAAQEAVFVDARKQQPIEKIGSALNLKSSPSPTDVVVLGDHLYLSADLRRGNRIRGLLLDYDLNSRQWLKTMEFKDGPVSQLEKHGTTFFGRTKNDSLITLKDTRIHAVPFSRPLYDWKDAIGLKSSLYIATNGTIDLYDTVKRERIKKIDLRNGTGPVDLRGVVEGQPLSLATTRLGNQKPVKMAYWGERPMTGSGKPVEDISVGAGHIWTLRESGGKRFMEGHLLKNPTGKKNECLFRNPHPGKGTLVRDARKIDQQWIAITTNKGLKYYNSSYRSWYSSTGISAGKGRVFRFKSHLLLVDHSGNKDTPHVLRRVPVGKINWPKSCETRLVETPLTLVASAKAYAVDENNGEVVWIDANGGVQRFVDDPKDGSIIPVLAAANTGPYVESIRAIYRKSAKRLLATTANGLWEYHLDAYRWREIYLENLPLNVAEIAVTKDRNFVLVRDQQGNSYGGNLGVDGVILQSIYTGTSGSPLNGKLIEAYQGGQFGEFSTTFWYFLSDKGLSIYDVGKRRWHTHRPKQTTDLELKKSGNRLVLLSDHSRTWMVASDRGAVPKSWNTYRPTAKGTSFLDDAGDIYRLSSAGVLERGVPDRGGYQFEPRFSPMHLDPADVDGAWKADSVYLFRIGTSWKAYDFNNKKELTLRLNTSPSRPVRVFAHQGDTFIIHGGGLSLLDKGSSRLSVQNTIAGIDDLLHIGDELLIHDELGWRDLLGPDDDPIATFLLADGSPTTYYRRDKKLISSSLIPTYLPEDFRATVRDALELDNGDWWVLGKDKVYQMRTRNDETATDLAELEIVWSAELPSSDLHFVAQSRKGLLLSNGQRLVFSKDGDGYESIQQESLPKNPIEITMEKVSDPFKKLNSGVWAFDPIMEIKLKEGTIVAVRPTNEQVISSMANAFQDLEPLKTPAIRWKNHQFFVKKPDGTDKKYSPSAFQPRGQFLFDAISTVQASGSKYLAVGPLGVWSYPDSSLYLPGSEVTFHAFNASERQLAESFKSGFLRSSNGRIQTKGRRLQVSAENLSEAGPHSVKFGKLTFVEKARGVTADIVRSDGSSQPVRKRFPWDTGRVGIAYSDQGLLMQSNAGIHVLFDFQDFNVGPDGAAGQLVYENQPCFQGDKGWWKRHPNRSWQESNDFVNNRNLVSGKWKWVLRNGVLRVTNQTTQRAKGETIQWSADDSAFFAPDKLFNGAALGDLLFLSTQAGFEYGSLADIRSGSNIIDPPLRESDRLRTLATQNGEELYIPGQIVRRWAGRSFVRIKEDPFVNRTLFQQGPLRFRFVGGQFWAELKTQTSTNGSRWLRFETLVNKRFPFDKVNSMATWNNKLWLGSSAGLQAYANSNTALTSLDHFINPGASNSAIPKMVLKGQPLGNANILFAVDDHGVGYEATQSGFKKSTRRYTGPWLRAKNELWQWTREADGIKGKYISKKSRSSQGLPAGKIAINNGRFPHDRLKDLVVYKDQTFSLWGDGWVSLHQGSSLSLRSAQSQNFENQGPIKFIHIENDTQVGNLLALEGLYLACARNSFFRFENGTWNQVSDPNRVAAFMKSPPIYQKDRLRLDQSKPFEFEYLGTNAGNVWTRLPWYGGRVALDVWDAFVQIEDTWWAATPAGLVGYQRSGSSVTLDLASLPVLVDLKTASPNTSRKRATDMVFSDGQLFVRMSNGEVHVGHPGKPSGAAFEKIDLDRVSDPFFDQPLSLQDPEMFQLFRSGRQPREQDHLFGTFKGADLILRKGRFSFDHLDSIAFLDDLHVAAQGWYRFPSDDMNLKRFELFQVNGIDGRQVTKLGKTYHNGAETLLLETGGPETEAATFTWLPKRKPEQLTAAEVFLGDDGFWRYFKTAEGLIKAEGKQDGKRVLRQGRFSDDEVIGLPITAGSGRERYHLIPTTAGIWHCDDDLNRTNIHVPTFPGCGEDTSPVAINLLHGKPVYVGEKGLYSLLEKRLMAPFDTLWDADKKIRRLDHGSGMSLQLVWEKDGRPGWNNFWFTKEGWRLTGDNRRLVYVGGFTNYASLKPSGKGDEKWLELKLSPNELQLGPVGQAPVVREGLPKDFRFFRLLTYKDRLMLFAPGELLEVNLDKGLFQVYGKQPNL